VTTPGEPREKTEVKPAVPLKRKIGTISAAGPTYKGIDLIKNRQIIIMSLGKCRSSYLSR
jgi:hypothetical protein